MPENIMTHCVNWEGFVNLCCVFCSNNFYFWILKTILMLSEPFICSFAPVGFFFNLQILVLAISIFMFILQLIGESSSRKKEIDVFNKIGQSIINSNRKSILRSHWKTIKFYLSRGDYVLEVGCFVIGVLFIFFRPGIAALRCFRVFRILWYFQLEVFTNDLAYYSYRIFGKGGLKTLGRIFDVMEFAVLSIVSLGSEIFFLNEKTRGGFVLMAILFYSAYVLGLMLWIETGSQFDACHKLGKCTYTMFRVSMFDGSGLDYAFALVDYDFFLFVILMIYLCITSFGIVNGLLSTFAGSFSDSNSLVFQDLQRREENMLKMKNYVYTRLMKVNCQYIEESNSSSSSSSSEDEAECDDNVEDIESSGFGHSEAGSAKDKKVNIDDDALPTTVGVTPSKPPSVNIESTVISRKQTTSNKSLSQKSPYARAASKSPGTGTSMQQSMFSPKNQNLGFQRRVGFVTSVNSANAAQNSNYRYDDIANILIEMRRSQEELAIGLRAEFDDLRSLRQEHEDIKKLFIDGIDTMKLEIDSLKLLIKSSVIITQK